MEHIFAEYLERLGAMLHEFDELVSAVPEEALNWSPGPEMNSLGVLVLHTVGATRFLLGDLMMDEPAERDRDRELHATDATQAELKQRLADVEAYVQDALNRLSLADLAAIRQIPGRTSERTVSYALLHALEHVGQHLGHAHITRQLWAQHNG